MEFTLGKYENEACEKENRFYTLCYKYGSHQKYSLWIKKIEFEKLNIKIEYDKLSFLKIFNLSEEDEWYYIDIEDEQVCLKTMGNNKLF